MSEKAKETEEDLVRFKCPACQDGMVNLHKAVYDLPDGDKMLILKFECDKCNYTKNDIIPLTTNMKPGKMVLCVEDAEDLKSKIYRSPTGKLEIPELELVVEPGPSAQLYFTNVEGILYRFEAAVRIYRNDLDFDEADDSEKDEIDEILNDIQKALEGNFKFTLKITDPDGGSYIIPQDEKKYSFEKIDNEKK